MRSVTRRKTAAVSVALFAVMLSGCGSEGAPEPGAPAEGGGVAYGATIEEYHAAFADVDPVTLKYQFTAGIGSEVNAPYEEYLDAVEEWSDGKVTFDRAYSASLVPNTAEWSAALADGRLDLTWFLPYTTPGVFPKLSLLADGSLLDGTEPTATLLSTAVFTDAVYADPALGAEAEAGGVHVLLRTPNFALTGYFCPEARTSLDDFAGANVSVAGAGVFVQAAALGAQPQSIAYTELYEALQRGVVDCVASSPTTVQTFGATEIVPSFTIDRDSGLSNFLGYYAIGKEKWDSLPLIAQQVLFDRLDTLIEILPRTDGDRIVKWYSDVQAIGGGIVEFEADASRALSVANEEILAKMAEGGVDVDRLLETRDDWSSILNDELYADLPDSIEEFLQEGGFGDDVDLSIYTKALYERVLLEHRPG